MEYVGETYVDQNDDGSIFRNRTFETGGITEKDKKVRGLTIRFGSYRTGHTVQVYSCFYGYCNSTTV